MNLYIATVLHVVTSLSIGGAPLQLTYIEQGAPTVCAFQSLSWDGSAWHAQVSGCRNDRIFEDGFQ